MLLLFIAGISGCTSIGAETPKTEDVPITETATQLKHTKRLGEGEVGQKAKLGEVEWLVGNWEGEAFGSKFEQVWNPASSGSMVGMFKLMRDDKVVFYELLLLVEENDSLAIKVKHFNPDFTAWEEKADFINFPLVKVEENAIHFSGLSFYKKSDNEMDGYIVFRDGDQVTENKLVYRRVKNRSSDKIMLPVISRSIHEQEAQTK